MEMKKLFSEQEKRARWRKAWLALARAEHDFGLVSKQELESIRSESAPENVDVPAALEAERKLRHDLMAELEVFASRAKRGGGKLHLGATSADIEDNTDIGIYLGALEIITRRLVGCLSVTREKIVRYSGTACMGWTHLQPAEPTTIGYRFANYAQDLLLDLELIDTVKEHFLLGKGVKGAVGTSASFGVLLGSSDKSRDLESSVMKQLGLRPFEVSTQTYPRKVDFAVLACLASVAQSCHRFGLDLRVMQSPAIGEWSEPFGKEQVGSSAMPFKRNPVQAERMCSLARLVSVLPEVGFMNAANAILERTLDDSAARRIVIPEAFLAVDECLQIFERLMGGIRVYPEMIKKNLERYAPFAGTEALLMELVRNGADRQKAHELIRGKSSQAWQQVMRGKPNPLERMLATDRRIASKVTKEELHRLMDPSGYTGDAKERCASFVKHLLDPAVARYSRGRRRQKTTT
jgi:adenylosuccinate lyase